MTATGATCRNCGAPLSGTKYEKVVTCGHCRVEQPNLDCLAIGDEVLRSDSFLGVYVLLQVKGCRGPDAIELEPRPGAGPYAPQGGTTRLDDVVPVVRATDDLPKGSVVFRRDDMGWMRTWTASAPKNGQVKVKHTNDAFQDTFFDRNVGVEDIRLPARAGDRGKRSGAQAFLDRAKKDPVSVAFDITFKSAMVGCFGFVALYGLYVAATLIWTFLGH